MTKSARPLSFNLLSFPSPSNYQSPDVRLTMCIRDVLLSNHSPLNSISLTSNGRKWLSPELHLTLRRLTLLLSISWYEPYSRTVREEEQRVQTPEPETKKWGTLQARHFKLNRQVPSILTLHSLLRLPLLQGVCVREGVCQRYGAVLAQPQRRNRQVGLINYSHSQITTLDKPCDAALMVMYALLLFSQRVGLFVFKLRRLLLQQPHHLLQVMTRYLNRYQPQPHICLSASTAFTVCSIKRNSAAFINYISSIILFLLLMTLQTLSNSDFHSSYINQRSCFQVSVQTRQVISVI